ncbi:MAG: UbiA family prenyltransferase [Candidatus Paceibacterota bacterium]|jgi:4-hydroxybenzoate polyprenyltransferase
MNHSKSLSLINKLYIYQEKRFPVVFLTLSILPVILSSAVIITQGKINLLSILLAFIASLCYFLHIRIIDDCRDFNHDNLCHPDRPVQAGIISLSELKRVDLIMILIFLIISIFSNLYSLVLATLLLIYTYFASNDFFISKKIRKYFYLYNLVNLFQMIILQVFIYAFFSKNLYISNLLLLHFAFIITGTLIFEFLRKLKIPEAEGIGKDTYSWHMGFGRSIAFYLLLVVLNTFLFFKIVVFASLDLNGFMVISLIFILLSSLFACLFWIKRSDNMNKAMQVVSLSGYGLFNMIIYFTNYKI